MKASQLFARVIVFGFTLCFFAKSHAASTNTNTVVTGQWDFNNGDLTATVGQPMQYLGDGTAAATVFSTVPINGTDAKVMSFPATAADQGYLVIDGAQGNGGGTNVNDYTLIMDIAFPDDFSWRALLQTRTNAPLDEAELFVNPLGAVGTGNFYYGAIPGDTWTRLAITVSVTNNALSIYTNGTIAGTVPLNTPVDGVWSVGPSFILFNDNGGNTGAGSVNSIQFRSGVMTADEIAALGGPTAGGISSSPNVSPFKITIAKSAPNVHITVDTPGTYQLQTSPTINNPVWTDVGPPNTTGVWDVPINTASKTAFFQLKK
jgi:hypothetical protein